MIPFPTGQGWREESWCGLLEFLNVKVVVNQISHQAMKYQLWIVEHEPKISSST